MKKNKSVTSHKNFFSKFFAIIFIIVSFVLCVSLADLLSSFITITTFQNNQTTNKMSTYSIYAISLNSSSIRSSANEYVQSIQKSGGAGFVWEKDGVFYVLASCYAEENDANLVKTNISNTTLNPEILKLDFSEITITSSFNSKQTSTLSEALNLCKTTYKNLYDISISLDTSILTEIQSKLEINAIESKISNLISNFETLFDGSLSNNLLLLKLCLDDVLEVVSEIASFVASDNQSLSSKIKYNYIKVLELNKKLCTSISSI